MVGNIEANAFFIQHCLPSEQWLNRELKQSFYCRTCLFFTQGYSLKILWTDCLRSWFQSWTKEHQERSNLHNSNRSSQILEINRFMEHRFFIRLVARSYILYRWLPQWSHPCKLQDSYWPIVTIATMPPLLCPLNVVFHLSISSFSCFLPWYTWLHVFCKVSIN